MGPPFGRSARSRGPSSARPPLCPPPSSRPSTHPAASPTGAWAPAAAQAPALLPAAAGTRAPAPAQTPPIKRTPGPCTLSLQASLRVNRVQRMPASNVVSTQLLCSDLQSLAGPPAIECCATHCTPQSLQASNLMCTSVHLGKDPRHRRRIGHTQAETTAVVEGGEDKTCMGG